VLREDLISPYQLKTRTRTNSWNAKKKKKGPAKKARKAQERSDYFFCGTVGDAFAFLRRIPVFLVFSWVRSEVAAGKGGKKEKEKRNGRREKNKKKAQ